MLGDSLMFGFTTVSGTTISSIAVLFSELSDIEQNHSTRLQGYFSGGLSQDRVEERGTD